MRVMSGRAVSGVALHGERRHAGVGQLRRRAGVQRAEVHHGRLADTEDEPDRKECTERARGEFPRHRLQVTDVPSVPVYFEFPEGWQNG